MNYFSPAASKVSTWRYLYWVLSFPRSLKRFEKYKLHKTRRTLHRPYRTASPYYVLDPYFRRKKQKVPRAQRRLLRCYKSLDIAELCQGGCSDCRASFFLVRPISQRIGGKYQHCRSSKQHPFSDPQPKLWPVLTSSSWHEGLGTQSGGCTSCSGPRRNVRMIPSTQNYRDIDRGVASVNVQLFPTTRRRAEDF